MKSIDYCKVKLVREKTVDYTAVKNADDVVSILRSIGLHEACEEYFYLICLDTKGNPAGLHEVSHGTINSSVVHPREVFKRAIANNAAAVIVVHNHPSGDVTPSNEDINVTKRLIDAGELLGIKLIDHIIISHENSQSIINYC